MRRLEASLAALLTLAAIWLRLEASLSPGALWRDEANTVALATLPTITDVWTQLQYDSFPLLWLLIVRAIAQLFGPLNDQAFRVAGFLVGLGLVGTLWYYARTISRSVPLVSLALLGLAPSVIVWGDSIRAYGAGITVMLLTGALMWRFVERPSASRFCAVTIVAIVSVNILFYNSVLLLGFCAAGVAVCAVHRTWKKAGLVVVVGAVAALTIIPYASTIRDAAQWNPIVQFPDYTVSWFFMRLHDTLRPGGFLAQITWLELFVLAVFVGQRTVRLHEKLGRSQQQRDAAVFSLVALLAGTTAYFLFLKALSYWTAPWYYLALLALWAVCFDVLFASWIRTRLARVTRVVGVSVFALATLFPATSVARTRLTNVDLVTSRLNAVARPRDFVLVYDWHSGVSFFRYYHGSAPWTTVPPIGFYRYHRYDVLKKHMMAQDQMAPVRAVIEQAEETLRTGNKVYIVTNEPLDRFSPPTALMRPAPLEGNRWPEYPYLAQWIGIVHFTVMQHAATLSTIPTKRTGRVNEFEDLQLFVARGWRP